ncbi:MAG: cytidylate kinase-like family protein [Chloroflexi bacterium]|nr:cytidylate kinase-like family protein [Chloroflexota bacterium]
MSVITIDGQIGAGAPEVGRKVAEALRVDYYDRLLLAGIARRVGATVAAVEAKEHRMHNWGDRFREIAERAMNSLALSASAGDPYFGSFLSESLPLTWDESADGPRTTPHSIRASALAKATSEHIHEVAEGGDAVIVHRAGCVELQDHPETLHVGLFAPMRDRIWRVMTREGFMRPEEAEEAIREREKSQVAYFQNYHSVHPHDEGLYDLSIKTQVSDVDIVAMKIVHSLRGRNDISGVALA